MVKEFLIQKIYGIASQLFLIHSISLQNKQTKKYFLKFVLHLVYFHTVGINEVGMVQMSCFIYAVFQVSVMKL